MPGHSYAEYTLDLKAKKVRDLSRNARLPCWADVHRAPDNVRRQIDFDLACLNVTVPVNPVTH